MKTFCWPVRIYYEDTDHGGVVYYANYPRFMERARTELLRYKGVEQDKLIENHDVIFAVKHVEVDFIASAKFNDMLLVTVNFSESSRVKLTFEQQIYRVSADKQSKFPPHQSNFLEDEQIAHDAELLCVGKCTVASLAASTMRPKRLPVPIFEELMREY